jgi:sugar lactone lactonase YvrE
VPGTRLSGDNGVAVSPDGKWLFVNATGTDQIYRVPLSGTGERSSAKVDFHPDNLRWTPDGKLFVTGNLANAQNFLSRHGWAVARLDPETMTVAPVVKEPGYAEFDNATSTVQVGQTLWFGTYGADRIAYRPAP